MTELTADYILNEEGSKVATKRRSERVRPSIVAILCELLPWLLLLSGSYLAWNRFLAADASGSPLWFDLARIGLAVEIIRRYLNQCYTIREHSIRKHDGLFATSYKSSTVKFQDIREIRVQQNLLGRLIGFGDVMIGTASTSHYEIEMNSVPNPAAIASHIQSLRLKNKVTMEQDAFTGFDD